VALPSAQAGLAALADPARWPDFGCALGRFTALRSGAGGLDAAPAVARGWLRAPQGADSAGAAAGHRTAH
jgi:hypothetical protein